MKTLVKFNVRKLNQIHSGHRKRINGKDCFVWTWFGTMRKRTLYVEITECDVIEEEEEEEEEEVKNL